MISYKSAPKSLFDLWNLYQLEVQDTLPKQKASVALSLTKTALIRYVLPGWGLESPKHKRMTAWETYLGVNFMKCVDLEQFSQAAQIQQQVFEQQQVPLDMQRTYRAALNRLLVWCETQSWWNYKPQIKPDSQQRKRGMRHKRENSSARRPKYGLGSVKGDFISEHLQQELVAFQEFRVLQGNVRQSTVDKDLRQIRLALGWLHRIKGISLEELSLQHMVPVVDVEMSKPEQISAVEAAAFKTRDLAREYIDWLTVLGTESTSGSARSVYTSMDAIRIFLIVAQFNYRDWPQLQPQLTAAKRYYDVPVVQLLRQELAELQSIAKQQRSLQQPLKEIVDWSEFLEIVEKLRSACAVKTVHIYPEHKDDDPNPRRALLAIASNYQSFLLAALFCYIPPQRQQVYRNLKILGSRYGHKRADLIKNLEESVYLYEEQDQWYILLGKDAYKTKKNYQRLLVTIPNIQYLDERCFYQYLHEWLNEYSYQTLDGKKEKIGGLRKVFNPKHEYFFTQKNGERFSHATNFSKLLQNACQEFSQTALTPQLIKKMFVKHISKYSPEIKSQIIDLLLQSAGSYKDGVDEQIDVWMRRETIEISREFAERTAQEFLQF